MIPPEQLRLASLRALNLLDTPPEDRFDRISRLAQRTFGVPIALITLIDENRVWFKSRLGLEEHEVPRNGSFCEEALICEGLVIVPDATKDPRFADHPLVAAGPKIRFYAGHPLAGPDGSILGTLSLLDRVPRELDLEQRRALRDLAGMVEEQLASPQKDAEPDDEHSRLLARLRLSPEHTAARRKIRVVFLAVVAALILFTGFSVRLANRVTADADRIESIETDAGHAPTSAAEKDALTSLHSTVRFLRTALGARALIAVTLLFIILVIFDRHMDARLSAMAAVELDRARLQSVIDAIGDGIVVADASERFTVFNPAAERILGLGLVDDSEHSNRFYRSFFDESGAPCAPERHPLARAIAGEDMRGQKFIVRNERRPGGLTVVVTATTVRAADGSRAGGVIIFRDVV